MSIDLGIACQTPASDDDRAIPDECSDRIDGMTPMTSRRSSRHAAVSPACSARWSRPSASRSRHGQGGDLAAGEAAAFAKGHREGVVVSDNGRVRLGHALARWARSTPRGSGTWRGRRAATSTPPPATRARSFARGQGRRAWTVAYDATTRRSCPWPSARTARLRRDRSERPGRRPDRSQASRSRPDPKVQYIWDLAADPQGNLYAATGPTGQLWKRSADGKWSLLLDSRHAHLLCVAVGPDGSVYAGSDGEGLIYRVGPGRQGVDRLRRPPERDPHPPLRARRRALRGHGGRGRRWRRLGARLARLLQRRSRRAPSPPAPPRHGGGERRGRRASRRRPKPRRAGPTAPGDSRGGLGRAPPGLAGRQRRLSARRRRRPARGLPGQGPDLRAGLAGRPPAGRDRARGAALRGPRPRPGDGPDRQARQRPDPLAARRARRATCSWARAIPARWSGSCPGHVRAGTLVSEVHDTKLVSRFGALSGGPSSPRARRSRSRPAPAMSASPTRPGRPGRPSRPTPTARSRSCPPAGSSSTGSSSRPATRGHARAALGRAPLPDGEPAPRDHPARRPRRQRRRRGDAADPADAALGRDRPQRRRSELHAAGPQGRLARLDPARRPADHREASPGTRPPSPRGSTASASSPATAPRTTPTTP